MRISIILCLVITLGIHALAAITPPTNPGVKPAIPQNDAAGIVQAKVVTGTTNNQGTVMESTKAGLFVIINGNIVKYENATLEELGKLALLPALPATPPDVRVDRTAFMKYFSDQAQRRIAPQVISTDTELLLYYVGQYYRIDSDKMEIKAQSVVVKPPVAGGIIFQMNNAPPTATMIANDKAVYFLTDTEIISIDKETGKELLRSKIPVGIAVAPPVQWNPNPGGGPGAGGYTPPTPVKTTVTKIGTVINHADVEGGIWTIKDDTLDEYILTGTKLETLLAEDGIEGKKIRVTGIMTPPGGAHNFGKGSIEFTDYQVIPE